VHVLAARPLGPVGVDLQVAVVDLHVCVAGQERGDDHGRERRMAPVGLVERAQTYEAMLSPLGLEDPVGVFAPDGERRRLEARLLARARLETLDAEPPVSRPA